MIIFAVFFVSTKLNSAQEHLCGIIPNLIFNFVPQSKIIQFLHFLTLSNLLLSFKSIISLRNETGMLFSNISLQFFYKRHTSVCVYMRHWVIKNLYVYIQVYKYFFNLSAGSTLSPLHT